jgi:hypothetical protein
MAGSEHPPSYGAMIFFDRPLLETFTRVEIRGEDLDLGGRFTRQHASLTNKLSYRLRDSIPSRTSGDNVLSLQAIRVEGDLRPSYNFDIHGTEVGIIGDGQPDLYCLVTMLSGTLEMVDGPNGTGGAWAKGPDLSGSAGHAVPDL